MSRIITRLCCRQCTAIPRRAAPVLHAYCHSHFRISYPSLAVIDNDQKVGTSARGGSDTSVRLSEEALKLGELFRIGHVFAAWPMQDKSLAVASDLKRTVLGVGGFDSGEGTDHGPDIPPLQVMWQR